MKSVGNERGMVLLVVLLIITLLSVLLSEFSFSTLVDLRLAETFRDSTRGYYLARGGITLGTTLISQDKNGYDAPNDPTEIWSQGLPSYPVGGGYLSLSAEDLSGRLNLNRLFVNGNVDAINKDRFLALCDELGVAEGDALVDALIDWLDNDDNEQPKGAESRYYLGLQPPYPAKNGAIDTLEELGLIKGFDAETLKLLAPYIALFGSDNVNVNSASRELLMAVMIAKQLAPADAQSAVDGIISQREQGAIKTAQELSDLATQFGFTVDRLAVDSSAFRIVADAEVNDGRRTITAVVDHDGKLLQQKVD